MPLLLQCVRDILGHVILVVFSEHRVGLEYTGSIERAFCDHALSFAKQIRKYALVGKGKGGTAVGNLERDGQIVAANQRARLDEAAEPETLPRLDMLLGDHR